MKNGLFLMLVIIMMVSGCSGGNHDRTPTNAERQMKGQWVPLHNQDTLKN